MRDVNRGWALAGEPIRDPAARKSRMKQRHEIKTRGYEEKTF